MENGILCHAEADMLRIDALTRLRDDAGSEPQCIQQIGRPADYVQVTEERKALE
jgi:hypothetical protein